MSVEKAATNNFDIVVGECWPSLDEDLYVKIAENQEKTAAAVTAAVTLADIAVSDVLGPTALASDSLVSSTALTDRVSIHANRALTAALLAINIVDAKTRLNDNVRDFEAEEAALKVKSETEGWTPREYDAKHRTLIYAHSEQSQPLAHK